MDLSQPRGGSINEGIDKESFKVQYSHFNDATDLVYKMGINCVKSTYNMPLDFYQLKITVAFTRHTMAPPVLHKHSITIRITISTQHFQQYCQYHMLDTSKHCIHTKYSSLL